MAGIRVRVDTCISVINAKGGFMATLWQDVRYAFRMLAKSPMLTAIVILTLTLGIGANTAIFGLVNGLLLRPLPVKSPDQIMVLAAQVQGDTLGIYTLSYSELVDIRKQSDVFSDVFASKVNFGGLRYEGKANQFVYSYVTGNYFSGLGVQPALGRLFFPAEGEAGGKTPYIVLGYDFWQKQYGGDPAVVGKQALLDGRGGSLKQAQSLLDVVTARLAQQYPATDVGITVRIIPERLARPSPFASNL